MEKIIEVNRLTKIYNNKIVLDDISFTLSKGESLGVLGSNGAGKTTLLESIEGLRKIDKGEIVVLNKNVAKEYKTIQSQIGIQLQKSSLFGDLSVKDNLKLYSKLYNRKKNIDLLLSDFELIDHKNQKVKNLSGGLFQRLNLCIAMINEPTILFLDEPTTGLDPKARRILWERIKELKRNGASLILTTHYMEEAENLCDKIIILHEGKMLANDSPQHLIKKLDVPRVFMIELAEKANGNFFNNSKCSIYNNQVYVKSTDASKDLSEILNIIETNSIKINNISIHEANLEDVYMELTKAKLKNGEIVK
jgi:ABC-2 type transport system ATP-binding protein